MRRGKLLIITLGVVIAGILAALPYQRAPEPSPADQDFAEREAVLPLRSGRNKRSNDLVTLSLSPSDDLHALGDESPAAEFLRSAREREPMLELPQIRRDDALRTESLVPEMAASFRPFTETIRLLRDADASQQVASSSLAPVNTTPPADLVVDELSQRPTRRHRIVDGDTLESLAERYYGDASLSATLFAANRDILTDPAVLPLGTELEIPRSPETPSSRTSILGVPHGVSAEGEPVLSPLSTPLKPIVADDVP